MVIHDQAFMMLASQFSWKRSFSSIYAEDEEDLWKCNAFNGVEDLKGCSLITG